MAGMSPGADALGMMGDMGGVDAAGLAGAGGLPPELVGASSDMGMLPSGMEGLPPGMGVPGVQFPSTDPMSIAQLIAGLFKQMADADHSMLESQQQAAFMQADPIIRAILGQDMEGGASMMPGMGMQSDMMPGEAFGEGGQVPSAFGED